MRFILVLIFSFLTQFKLFKGDKEGLNIFVPSASRRTISKILIFSNKVIGFIDDKIIEIQETANDFNFIFQNWNYYPSLLTSTPIVINSYALIALMAEVNNVEIGIIQFNMDKTNSIKTTIPASFLQGFPGFSQFIDQSSYLLSYINSNNEGIIGIYKHNFLNQSNFSGADTITNYYKGNINQVFQCSYINSTPSKILCLLFDGGSLDYILKVYSNKIIGINVFFFPIFTSCNSCSANEGNLNYILTNKDNIIIVKSFPEYIGLDLIKVDWGSNVLAKYGSNIIKTKYSYQWKNANFALLNDDYFLIVGSDNTNPALFLVYLREMAFLLLPEIIHSHNKVIGFDISIKGTNPYQLFSFGAFNNENKNEYQVYAYSFQLITSINVNYKCSHLENNLNLSSLTNPQENDSTLEMCFYSLPSPDVLIEGIKKGSNNHEKVTIYQDTQQCYSSIKFKCEVDGDYLFKYYLIRQFKSNKFLIPSFLSSFELSSSCYSSCKTCQKKGTSSEHQCLSCKNGYGLLYGTSNCILPNEKPNNYKEGQNEKGELIYYKCANNCETCYGPETPTSENCSKCIVGTFFILDRVQGNCYADTPGNGYYYAANDNIFKPCYERCLQCTTGGDSVFHNCDRCKPEFGKTVGSSICILPNEKKENFYEIIDSNGDRIFHECGTNCKTCNQGPDLVSDNCRQCKDGLYLIDDKITGKCYSEKPGEGYYLDSVAQTYKRCYKKCSTCYGEGNALRNNCASCKDGYIMNFFFETNCVKNCEHKFYTDKTDNEHCIEKCPSSYPYLVKHLNKCVENCRDHYSYYNTCYSSCPPGTIEDSNNRICKNKIGNAVYSSENSSPNQDVYISDASTESLYNNIDNAIAISLISPEKNKVTVIKNNEMTFNCYPTSLNKSALDSTNSPYIELGQCEEILRKVYKLSPEEKLYIGTIVYDKGNKAPYNSSTYVVFDSLGQRLNLSVCEDTPIKETKKLNTNCESLNYEIAQALMKEGINIYDSNEKVFNDKCIPLEYNGKDTSLSARRTKIQSQIPLCSENCKLVNVNFSTDEVECECAPVKDPPPLNSLVAENEILQQVKEIFSSTNMFLFTCYKTISRIKQIFQNYGGIISIVFIVCEIILMILFSSSQINKVLILITKDIRLNPPKKNSMIPLTIDTEKQASYDKPIKEFCTKESYMSEQDELNEINKNEILEYDQDELNSMEFEEAKEKDTRPFIKYLFSVVGEKQLILAPIFHHSVFQPLLLRLILFLFCIHNFLFVNALFFTEEYISKRYNSEEKLDIFYILHHEIKKSIFASLAAIAIQKIFSFLITKSSSYYKLINDKDARTIKYELVKLIKSLKRNTIILFIVIIICSLMFFYILLSFCYIFKNNQISWLESTLISIAGNLLIYFVLCLILAILRTVALKYDKP